MTDDFSSEERRVLRAALGHLERQAPDAPSLPQLAAAEPRRMWPRPVIVIAGFVVAGLIAFPGLWWLRSNETAGPATSTTSAAAPTSTTTTGAPTPTTTAPVTASGITFRRVSDPLGAFESGTLVETAPSDTPGDTLGGTSGIEVAAVVDSPEGLVAVGHEQIGLRSIAAAWFSEDGGHTWERVAADHATFGDTSHAISNVIPTGLSMTTVAYGQGRFVALGSDTTTDMTPVAWVSEDGRSWTRIADGPESGAGYATVSGVAFGTSGFVGIGNESHISGDITATTVLVWTSLDGLTWNTHRGAIGADRPSIVADLTKIGPSLVAVGYTVDPEAVAAWNSPAAWVSTDGVTWSAAQVIDPMADPTRYTAMRSVAMTPLGGVAFGWTMTTESLLGSSTDILVWTTVDGTLWTPVDVGQLAEDSVRIPGPLATGSAGLVATISLHAEGLAAYEPGLLVWTSEDGAAWDQTLLGFLGQVRDITFTSAGYVAVGSAPRPTAEIEADPVIWDGAVWIGTTE